MDQKINKISEQDKLKLRKTQLRLEIEDCTQSLNGHVDYLQHNMGGLFVNTITSAVSKKISPIMDWFPFFGKKTEPVSGIAASESQEKETKGIILERILESLPLVLEIARPIVVNFLIKKIKVWLSKK